MKVTRRSFRKSFTGCDQCKKRRVKCDETRPFCFRCRRLNISCSGFHHRLRWSTKHEVFPLPEKAATRVLESPSQGTSPSTCATASPTTSNGIESPPTQNITSVLGTDISTGEVDNPLSATDMPTSLSDDEQLECFPLSEDQAAGGAEDTTYPASCQLYHQPTDATTFLVEFYFRKICPLFSCFDGELNPFRSFVASRWQNSVMMVSTIQSMSAAKLSISEPEMSLRGLNSQTTALTHVSQTISSSGDQIDLETIYVIFMLGLSTCWHNVKDFGLVHLKAAQQVARGNNGIGNAVFEHYLSSFLDGALIYWEMLASVVDDEVEIHDISCIEKLDGLSRNDSGQIDPHPWTGIAAAPQVLFAHISRLIRRVRSLQSRIAVSPAHLEKLCEEAAELESQVWNLGLPGLCQINCTGDENTPAIHHLLLAEAHILANAYQIYTVFPDMWSERRQRLVSLDMIHTSIRRPGAMYRLDCWRSFLDADADIKEWLRTLALNIMARLQQIPVSSGTSCMQTILLLVCAGSLAHPLAGPSERIAQARRFVLDRLSNLHRLFGSGPTVVASRVMDEMFRIQDRGRPVFWLDVLRNLDEETILG